MAIENIIKKVVILAVETSAPIQMHEGAKQVCRALNSDTLRQVLYKHHDDHGEFNYEQAIKDIRNIAINKAKSFKKKEASISGKEEG